MNGEPGIRDLVVTRLGTLVERRAVPAVSYAIVADGEVTVGGHGGTGADTVFQIGSVTKGLTGLLLADLAAAGRVPLPGRATTFDATPVQGHQGGRPVPPWHMGVMSAAGEPSPLDAPVIDALFRS